MTPDRSDGPPSLTKAQAQQRVDQVSAFGRELLDLERDGVLRLAPEDRARLDAYHAGLLGQFANRFDVDRSDRQRQMSLGMRIASLLGAVTLSAAVVLFFNRIWGLLATPAQLAVLVAAPLLMLVAIDVAARRERTLYVASIMAAVATAAFILDVNVVGVIFNMRPSPYALALWSAFAFIVAYTYGLRLLLAAGITAVMAFACALAAKSAGLDMAVSIGRPEPLLPAGALALAAASLGPNRRREGFPETWRLVGSIALLVPLIFLSTWSGVFSYLRWPEKVLGPIYDVAGFALAGAGIWVGIRAGWREVVRVATGFLVVFLYAKCFDWWWDWMPRYLFFLLLGGLAVAVLIVLGRFRSRLREV
jgi:uncharacterized membrane protein